MPQLQKAPRPHIGPRPQIVTNPNAVYVPPDAALVEGAILSRSLHAYMAAAWPIINQGRPFVDGWHIRAICEHLEAVSRGQIRKLLINIPFRCSKSLTVQVFWPSWEWTFAPQMQWLCLSYAAELSTRDSLRCRNVIESQWYRDRWGDVYSISTDQNVKNRYENTKHGVRISTSIGGLATGEGGDRVVIDDPHNMKEIHSEVSRKEVIRIWKESLCSRLNNPATGAFVGVMQRGHEKDFSGHVLSEEEGWDHLCYDYQTEILTNRGWVFFKDLTSSDLVAQVDTDGLDMSFVQPTDIIRYRYRGPMVQYKTANVDLLVTPDHRMVFKSKEHFDGGDKSLWADWGVKSTDKLPKHFYIPQAVRWERSDIASVELGGVSISGDDYARFMGVWVAEGCTTSTLYTDCLWTGRKDALRRKVIISQDKGAFADEIKVLVERLPYHFKVSGQGSKRPRHLHFLSPDRKLWEDLRVYGKSGDKFVPSIIKSMSVRQILLFLEWYGKGDGHRTVRNANSINYVSKSRRLIDDVQELLLRVGRTGGIGKRPNAYRITSRSSKRDGEQKWYGQVSPKHKRSVPYDNEVFCVSVPTGAIVVRRNGKPAVCGNCLPMEYELKRPVYVTYEDGTRGIKQADAKTLTTSLGFTDPRTVEGELLSPDRFTPAVIAALKPTLGTYGWSGQSQQRPTPSEGGLFPKASWRYYTKASLPVKFDEMIQSWDMAFKKTEDSSRVAGHVYARLGAERFLLYRTCKRMDFVESCKAVITTTQLFPQALRKLVEDKANGPAIINVLKNKVPGLYPVEPEGSKEARAQTASIYQQAGNVLLPHPDECPWTEELIEILAGVPLGEWDDADAFAQAMIYFGPVLAPIRLDDNSVFIGTGAVSSEDAPWALN